MHGARQSSSMCAYKSAHACYALAITDQLIVAGAGRIHALSPKRAELDAAAAPLLFAQPPPDPPQLPPPVQWDEKLNPEACE